jgi:uncharacterized protein with HEPN domain
MRRADKDLAYLDDIREACAVIMDYVKDKTLVEFVASRLLQDGVVRRLGIIGEAAKSLSTTAKERHPSVAWRDMARLRDLVVHHYWKVGLPELWSLATTDVPALLKTLS